MHITLLGLGLQFCLLEHSKSWYSYWQPQNKPSGSERSTFMRSSISQWHGLTHILLENLTLESQSRLWSNPLFLNTVVPHFLNIKKIIIACQTFMWLLSHQYNCPPFVHHSDVNTVNDGLGDKISIFVQFFCRFIAGLIIGFIFGWKLTLVILAVSPLLAGSAAVWSKVSTVYYWHNLAILKHF